MTQLKITNVAFKNLDIHCGDISLPNTILCQPDMFLPILLLLVDKTLSDKVLLEKIVTYDLIVNKESLLYIEAKNINFKNDAVLINILNKMEGVQCILSLFNMIDNDVNTNSYDLKRLCAYIRDKLSKCEENTVFDKSSRFEFLFNHITTPLLSETFLKEQNDLLNEMDLFDDETKEIETKNDEPFSLIDIYPQLNGVDKKVFDELAVLACANYLAENPKLNSIEDISNKEVLYVDEFVLLGAIINHPLLLKLISNYFNCQAYQVVFDDSIYALREKLKLTATTRSFGDSTTTWYKYAKKYALNLQLSENVLSCFSASFKKNKFNADNFIKALMTIDSPFFKAFISLNQHGNNTVKTAITSHKIQQSLNKKVIGQETAVSALCQGYLTSSIDKQQGPRLIYTFAGPSGVGKTYLATQLQSQLDEFEKTGYVLNVFNMEQYSNDRDASKLFGSGIQYADASLGMLTSEVRAQPRQILLFDEIEKAHSIVAQSLLSMLDSGVTKDQTSQEEIDFSQCIIIFTTNLGQDTLQKNPQNAAISIFDLLQQSENPSNKTKLSIEFINRLAKGFPILFSELKINHLIRLAELQISEEDSFSEQLSYHWPDNFASLMLQSMSPDISVRALKSSFSKHKSMILNRAIPHLDKNIQNVKFNVTIEQEAKRAGKKATQLLLLDDDSSVFDYVNTTQSEYNVFLCKSVQALPHAIESSHPDALLIDIETVEKAFLAQLIADLVKLNKKTPIFTYHLNQNGDYHHLNLLHDVREHFTIQPHDFTASFTTMLTRVEYYLKTEQKLFNMKRRNQQLQYQCKVTPQRDFLNVEYKQLSVTQLISSNDLKEGELFKHSLPELKLDDVIGLNRAKKRLEDVVSWLKSPDKLANFGVNIPSGFLFAGPPGTGKTFLAKALAGESGLPFFSVSSSELSESHAGGTTNNIKKLFATARKYAPAIIFIDEIDAIAGKRSSSGQGADRDRNLTVNALLTEMDGFTPQSDPIFVLAATNHPQLLDSAIVRPGRFDEKIYCDLPNAEARKQFFTRFSVKHKIDFSEEELGQLTSSSLGMSSAEIEQVFREAVYQAVGDNQELTSEGIKQTMVRVSYGMPSDHIQLSAQEKCRTAYHEAGHLLLTKLLFPKQHIDFVTIEPRNNALGFVATRDADEYESLSSIRVKHRLEVLLAGRVAEKIFTESVDEVSSGASGDIEKATQLAMHVIYEGGLDASIGPVNIGLLTKFEESDLLLKAQNSVQRWLVEAEVSAEARLIEHRDQLDRIANALIEKESLVRGEIEALFA